MFDRRQVSGFTMVELLVVMSIIAILMAMLLPAVNVAREAARRAGCANNIRQLGLALNAYHQTHRLFPPSLYVAPKENPLTTTNYQPNWVIAVLPFIEQLPLYKKFDFSKPVSDPANREPRGANIPLMLCSSDTGREIKFSKSSEGENWARGNYGANGSIIHLSTLNVGISSTYWSKGYYRGVMGANVACSIDDIYDGTTNTILLGELRIGLSEIDRRGTWAMGAPAASSLWGHSASDDIGPNNCADQADDIMGCADLYRALGSRMNKECMGCCRSCNNAQGTPRSRHPGGVNVCMVDGSTRFISDFVEKATSWTPNLNDFRTWERLNASADRLPVDLSRF
jgi:prepilin-type N-terminal cleavage/methylation domain-containing protein/prepilin-type processing-associated H-X9-DG protein